MEPLADHPSSLLCTPNTGPSAAEAHRRRSLEEASKRGLDSGDPHPTLPSSFHGVVFIDEEPFAVTGVALPFFGRRRLSAGLGDGLGGCQEGADSTGVFSELWVA